MKLKIAKRLFLGINFSVLLAGLSLLCVGLWLRLDGHTQTFLQVAQVDDTLQRLLVEIAGYMMFGVGAVAFIVSLLGFGAAAYEKTALLWMYSIVIFIAVLGQLTAASLGIVYRLRIKESLFVNMKSAVKNNYSIENDTFTNNFDITQIQLSCCAAGDIRDFDGSWWQTNIGIHQNWRGPPSCCVPRDKTAEPPVPINESQCKQAMIDPTLPEREKWFHIEGCYYNLSDWLRMHTAIIIGVSLGLTICTFAGLVSGCIFIRAIHTDIQVKVQPFERSVRMRQFRRHEKPRKIK